MKCLIKSNHMIWLVHITKKYSFLKRHNSQINKKHKRP